ncbi:MAG: hypothetical protein ACTSVE_04620, partial [Candidatus Helarchaeota archaeon]
MVIRDFHKKPRSLCPRCGGPMLEEKDENGNVKYKKCPACHYTVGLDTKKEEPKGIKIKMDEPIEEKSEDILIFHMVKDDMVKASELDSDHVSLVADKKQNIIFIWKGKFTSPGERFRAGTAATRLKSSERMYGAKTIMVDEGEEPDNFPDLTATAKKAEEEAKRKAEEEAKRKAEEEEARRKAEEEARRKAEEEEARRKAEEEAKRKAEEEAKRKAEEEAKRKAEEEAKRKAEE